MIQLSSNVINIFSGGVLSALTASRYLLSPTRSRYLRQNGSVPKLLVMDLSNDFADVKLCMIIEQCAVNQGLLLPEWYSRRIHDLCIVRTVAL